MKSDALSIEVVSTLLAALTVESTGRRDTGQLRRITLDAKHAPAGPVQRFELLCGVVFHQSADFCLGQSFRGLQSIR